MPTTLKQEARVDDRVSTYHSWEQPRCPYAISVCGGADNLVWGSGRYRKCKCVTVTEPFLVESVVRTSQLLSGAVVALWLQGSRSLATITNTTIFNIYTNTYDYNLKSNP